MVISLNFLNVSVLFVTFVIVCGGQSIVILVKAKKKLLFYASI